MLVRVGTFIVTTLLVATGVSAAAAIDSLWLHPPQPAQAQQLLETSMWWKVASYSFRSNTCSYSERTDPITVIFYGDVQQGRIYDHFYGHN